MTLAWHTLIDFHDCDPARLADANGIRQTLIISQLARWLLTEARHVQEHERGG